MTEWIIPDQLNKRFAFIMVWFYIINIRCILCFPVCVCSMVCGGHLWGILLHSDPAGVAGGLRPLMEWILGRENGNWKCQRLVCRSVSHNFSHQKNGQRRNGQKAVLILSHMNPSIHNTSLCMCYLTKGWRLSSRDIEHSGKYYVRLPHILLINW